MAMAVFGIVAAASLQVLTSATRTEARAEDRTVAARLAQSELDALRSLAPELLAVAPTATGYTATFEGAPTVTDPSGVVAPTSVLEVDGRQLTVHRFVVWQTVGADPQAYRRIVVEVTGPGGPVRLESGRAELGDG
jgi:type II secretory pathway pseudopilin PulG